MLAHKLEQSIEGPVVEICSEVVVDDAGVVVVVVVISLQQSNVFPLHSCP